MLPEALAQYRAHPSEFLEGIIVGLMRMLDMQPERSWCDDEAQERNSRGHPAVARVREYLNGTGAAMAWATGDGSPPLSIVLTAGQESEEGGVR
jgi:hypothetical protein